MSFQDKTIWTGNQDILGSLTETYSRNLYPRNIQEVMEWGSDLWLHEGLYTQTIRKAVRYFMTSLVISGGDRKVEASYSEYIEEHYDILEEAARVLEEAIGFGNSFTSIYQPTKRVLTCQNKNCLTEYNYSHIKNSITFDPDTLSFKGKCSACGWKGTFKQRDTVDPNAKKSLNIIHWDPGIIKINHNELTGNTRYTLHPSDDSHFVKRIKQGDPFFLEDTPWEIIKAVCQKTTLIFDNDRIFHMKFPPPAFIKKHTQGWGLPPFMSDFSTVVILMMLNRYNEVILSDYTVPMRLISPSRQSGMGGDGHMGADLLSQQPFDEIKDSIQTLISRHRYNPSEIQSSPFPLNYQLMGGEANQLVPVEILRHYETRLLQNMGFPSEFINGSLNASVAPMIGFKIFERTWQHAVNLTNRWLTWVMGRLGTIKRWQDVTAKTVPASSYEDPQLKQLKLELAGAQKISSTTAYRALNLDWEEEQKAMYEERIVQQELDQEFAEELEKRQLNAEALRTPSTGEKVLIQQQQQQAGAPPEGGVPMPGAGGPAGMGGVSDIEGIIEGTAEINDYTLDQLISTAQDVAKTIFSMPATIRRSTLINISNKYPALHAQVSKELDKLEQDIKLQGLTSARQQAQQQGPPVG